MKYTARAKGIAFATVTGVAVLLAPMATDPAFAEGSIAASSQTAAGNHGPRYVYGSGPTYTYDQAFAGVKTHIVGLSTGSGRTMITLTVTNVPQAMWGHAFGAHVHVNACGADPAAAGGHYANPQAPAGTHVDGNEIWLDFTV